MESKGADQQVARKGAAPRGEYRINVSHDELNKKRLESSETSELM